MHLLPESLRPLLWYLRWEDLDVQEDKHDIILNVINEGTMEQWRWLADVYGKEEIRQVLEQRLAKGRKKGPGSKKGKHTARAGKKELWIIKIRSQRELLKELFSKNLISKQDYRDLRQKAKGGYFRSLRHIKLYLTEHSLWLKKK